MLGFICGILCVWVHFTSFYAISSLALDENKPYLSNITIVEVISQRDHYYLKVRLNKIDNQPLSNIKPPFALLTFNNDQLLKVGDHVKTWLELEKYRSQKNYDVFDKERYAFSERLFFKGKQVGSIIEISNNYEADLIPISSRTIQCAEGMKIRFRKVQIGTANDWRPQCYEFFTKARITTIWY